MKFIASDFDGTIFIDNKFMKDALEAITSFQEAGNIFGLVTGRSFHTIDGLIRGSLRPDFVIANNGSHILVKNGQEMIELLKFTLDKDKLRRLVELYKPYFPTKIFTDQARTLTSINDLREGEHVLSLAIYTDKFLDNPFEDDFSFHKSLGVIDVINKEVSKQTGIDFIKDFYGYDKDIIAFGDDYNDISFLKETPFSFTLNRVRQEDVLRVCNYKVEDIRELIEKYGK